MHRSTHQRTGAPPPSPWRELLKRSVLAMAAMSTSVAHAFGPTGHRVSGAVADALLTPTASSRVRQILGMPLRTAATWADCVKDVVPVAGKGFVYRPEPQYHVACAAFETKPGIARMQDYVRRNWNQCDPPRHLTACHKKYHFTDVAIQRGRYDRAFAGTSGYDLVSAMGAIVEVLHGHPAPAPFSIKDQKEALLLLAHFAGDLHQPLHVGSVYLDASHRPFDPGDASAVIDPHTDTLGGNRLEDRSSNLHAAWDAVDRRLNSLAVPAAMLAEARALPPSEGEVADWPAAWASETVLRAQQAFEGVTYQRQGALKAGDWVATPADRAAYAKRRDALQKQQLARAGARMAELLNAAFR